MTADLSHLSDEELRKATVGALASYRGAHDLRGNLSRRVDDLGDEWERRGKNHLFQACVQEERAEWQALQKANAEAFANIKNFQRPTKKEEA